MPPATAEQTTTIPAGIWEVDSVHSSIGFEAKHMGISIFRGGFTRFAGRIEVTDGAVSAVEGTIDPDSIDVTDETLAGHLRSPDFFDVENHPEIRFASTAIEPAGEGFELVGDLTIRGITKPVELQVKVEGAAVGPDGSERIAFSAEGMIDRNDYDMTWNMDLGNGKEVLGGEVRLVLAAEAVRK
jgi:polyisoprenoid-binding protein YceI